LGELNIFDKDMSGMLIESEVKRVFILNNSGNRLFEFGVFQIFDKGLERVRSFGIGGN